MEKRDLDKVKRVTKVLAEPLRVRILEYLRGELQPTPEEPEKRVSPGPMSPKDLSEVLDKPLGNVSYHIRIMAKAGTVRLHHTEPVRGSLKHFYVLTPVGDTALKLCDVIIADA